MARRAPSRTTRRVVRRKSSNMLTKILIGLAAFFLVTTGVAVGFWVPKIGECNSLKTDKANLQASLEQTQADLAESQSDLASLQADKDALQAELDATKADLTSLVADLNDKLEAVAKIEGYFGSMLKYTAGEISGYGLYLAETIFVSDFGDVLDNIGNSQLSSWWGDAMAAYSADNYDTFCSYLAKIEDKLQDLIDDDIAAIEAALD